jgi:hypothetical protein
VASVLVEKCLGATAAARLGRAIAELEQEEEEEEEAAALAAQSAELEQAEQGAGTITQERRLAVRRVP